MALNQRFAIFLMMAAVDGQLAWRDHGPDGTLSRAFAAAVLGRDGAGGGWRGPMTGPLGAS